MEKTIGVSIRDVLSMDIFKHSKVVAGKDSTEKLINSVDVIETPDTVTRGALGTLLITSGYFLEDDSQALLNVVKKANEAGVAALGIRTGKYLVNIPSEAIELAESLKFTLIEIDQDKHFSDIITTVLSKIIDKQTQVLIDTQDLHQTLTTIMLNGGTMQDITAELHNRFGNSVAVISDRYSSFVISSSQERRKEINRILRKEKTRRYMNNDYKFSPGTYKIENDPVGMDYYTRIVIPIYSESIPYGYIYVWEDERALNNFEISIIESVSSLIALEIVKKAAMFEMENNHRSGFLNNLLSENPNNHQKAVAAAHLFDVDLSAPHQIVVMNLSDHKGELSISNSTLYRFNNLLIQILRNIAKSTAFKILFANTDNNIMLLCEWTHDMSDINRQQIIDLVVNLLSQINTGGLSDLVSIGVGRVYSNSFELYKSFGEAKKAAEYARIKDVKVVFYEDMGIYRILSYENLGQELELFRMEMLEPIITYDREKDSELIRTLENYFACNGNMTQLAKELDVHYNTVVYRLQKISELTKLDLSDEEDLLNLQIALKIHRINKN